MSEKILISFAEAASMLSISRSLLYQMASDNRLGPAVYHIGKRSLIKRRELIRWVEADMPGRERWLKERDDVKL